MTTTIQLICLRTVWRTDRTVVSDGGAGAAATGLWQGLRCCWTMLPRHVRTAKRNAFSCMAVVWSHFSSSVWTTHVTIHSANRGRVKSKIRLPYEVEEYTTTSPDAPRIASQTWSPIRFPRTRARPTGPASLAARRGQEGFAPFTHRGRHTRHAWARGPRAANTFRLGSWGWGAPAATRTRNVRRRARRNVSISVGEIRGQM